MRKNIESGLRLGARGASPNTPDELGESKKKMDKRKKNNGRKKGKVWEVKLSPPNKNSGYCLARKLGVHYM